MEILPKKKRKKQLKQSASRTDSSLPSISDSNAVHKSIPPSTIQSSTPAHPSSMSLKNSAKKQKSRTSNGPTTATAATKKSEQTQLIKNKNNKPKRKPAPGGQSLEQRTSSNQQQPQQHQLQPSLLQESDDLEEVEEKPLPFNGLTKEVWSALQKMTEGETREKKRSGGDLLEPQDVAVSEIPLATKKRRKKVIVVEARPPSETLTPLQALLRQKFKKAAKKPTELPPYKYVAAPLVGKSDLAFRMLCRRYGAQLAYTPMYEANKFAEDVAYRAQFQTHANDRPLAVQFCCNDGDVLLKAARLVESQCDMVDINLGCPQRRAHAGHYGAFLLDEPDHELVFEMVRKASQNLSIPLACKIRLLPTPEATLKFCLGLQEAGCSLIAVHARYRGSPTQPRDGPAHLDQLSSLKKALSIPIIANGNTRTYEDVEANLTFTTCDGSMAGEGLLDNPALFAPSIGKAAPDGPELALEYLALCREVGFPSIDWIRGNVLRMCRKPLLRYQLQPDLEQARDVKQVEHVVGQVIHYRDNPSSFRPDPLKTTKMQAALSAQKQAKKQARQEEFRRQKIARRAAERVAKE